MPRTFSVLAQVPMIRPVAGVEVGLINGSFVVNPTLQEMRNSSMHLTLAGTQDGILMIEGAAHFLPEETIMSALKVGHAAIGR